MTILKSILFATVPGSSINSWDSWFIFNLQKINTCYYTTYYTTKRQEDTLLLQESLRIHWQCNPCGFLDVNFLSNTCSMWSISWDSSLRSTRDWTMYILGLCSSCGTSRICPAWSPSEHLLSPALSPFGARVRSHAVRRRLFISLMTASHISPNVFSLWEFPSTHMITSYCAHIT